MTHEPENTYEAPQILRVGSFGGDTGGYVLPSPDNPRNGTLGYIPQ